MPRLLTRDQLSFLAFRAAEEQVSWRHFFIVTEPLDLGVAFVKQREGTWGTHFRLLYRWVEMPRWGWRLVSPPPLARPLVSIFGTWHEHWQVIRLHLGMWVKALVLAGDLLVLGS